MNKNQLLNIKKMIFELGRGGSKNHFFDRVNDVREVNRFFANAQNDTGSKMCGAGARGFCAPHIFKATSGHQLSTGLRGFFSKNKESEKNKIPAYKFIREFYFIDAVRRYSGKSAQTQTGRSMLEMLGVLAIIGVLSVGAVMGFRQAMNRHKANVILNDVSLAFEELATHETTGAVSRYQVTAFTPESGHTLYAKRDSDGNDSVEVQGIAKGVCEVLIQYDKTELYAQISDANGAKLTSCTDNQTMVFGLGTGGGTDPDPTPEPEPECASDDDCTAGKVCKNGVCEDFDPCEGVSCGDDEKCINGSCVDKCFDVLCQDSEKCVSGVCVDKCDGVTCEEGYKCSAGECVLDCADENASEECCQSLKGEDFHLIDGACIQYAGCIYDFPENLVESIGANCQIAMDATLSEKVESTCMITGYTAPEAERVCDDGTRCVEMPSVNVTGCSTGQYCRVQWTSNDCTGSLGESGASVMYGTCNDFSQTDMQCHRTQEYSTVAVTGCSSGQYCRVQWTSNDCSGGIGESGAAVMYGVCNGFSQTDLQCPRLTELTPANFIQKIGCSKNQYCSLQWTAEDCSSTISESSTGLMYGACVDYSTTGGSCPNN